MSAGSIQDISPYPIRERLADVGFRQIGGELEWGALKQAPPVGQLPAGYIVFEREGAGGNQADSGIVQKVDVDFMVAIVLEAQGRRVEELDDRLRIMRARTRDALVGWKHPEATGPTHYRGGNLLSADGQTIAWAVRFRAGYHLRRFA